MTWSASRGVRTAGNNLSICDHWYGFLVTVSSTNLNKHKRNVSGEIRGELTRSLLCCKSATPVTANVRYCSSSVSLTRVWAKTRLNKRSKHISFEQWKRIHAADHGDRSKRTTEIGDWCFAVSLQAFLRRLRPLDHLLRTSRGSNGMESLLAHSCSHGRRHTEELPPGHAAAYCFANVLQKRILSCELPNASFLVSENLSVATFSIEHLEPSCAASLIFRLHFTFFIYSILSSNTHDWCCCHGINCAIFMDMSWQVLNKHLTGHTSPLFIL